MTAPRPLVFSDRASAEQYVAQQMVCWVGWEVVQPAGRSHYQIQIGPDTYATRLDSDDANPAGIEFGDWVLCGTGVDADYGVVHTVDLDRRVAIARMRHLGGDVEVPLNPNDPDWTDDMEVYRSQDHDACQQAYVGRCQ